MIIDPYTWYQTGITNILPVAHDTIALRITRPHGYSFRAGQYTITRTQLADNRIFTRQYSLTSSPLADWLELTVQKEPGGEVTSWLHEQARVGDIIEISQSFGNFTFESISRPILFIAGKVGIAPFMSFLRQGGTHDVHVLYSVNNRAQLCYWDELQLITTAIVTSEQPRINQLSLAQYISNKPLVYICGSRQFAEAVQIHLLALGVPSADIRRELFTL